MNKEILDVYNTTYSKRYSKGQKIKFINHITSEFEALGYEHSIHNAKGKIARYRNLYIGNIKQAKIAFVIPYDTPSKIMWFKNKYYPQNGLVNMRKSFLPIYGPLLIGYAIFMAMIYLLPSLVNIGWLQNAIYIISLFYFIFLFIFITYGFSNKHNAQRNSASIALALDLAKKLPENRRKQVMFIFTDGNRQSKYFGNKELGSYIEDSHRSILCVAMHGLGLGDTLRVISDRNSKQSLKDMKKAYQGELSFKNESIQEIEKGGTAMEHLRNVCMISSGYMDKDGLYLSHTGTSKDNRVDEATLDGVEEMLETIIKKLK